MRLGRNNDRGIPGPESNANELRHIINKLSIVGVKPYLVVAGDLYILCGEGTVTMLSWLG